MRRLLAFFGGVLSGGAIGTAVALLLTPRSGDSMRDSLRARWVAAKQAGEEAATRKRKELEARLYDITGPHPPDSPMVGGGQEASNGAARSSNR